MHDKTLSEEVPVLKESLLIYQKGIIKELDKYEPMVKRLRAVLKICNERLEKFNLK